MLFGRKHLVFPVSPQIIQDPKHILVLKNKIEVNAMKQVFVMLIILVLLLTGCIPCPAPQQPEFAVVTGVDITHYLGNLQEQRQYATDENISMVLNYLRLLHTLGAPQEDPSAESGGTYHIIVEFSDGTTKEYAQKADRYLWEEGVGWRIIDEEQGVQLGQLFRAIPSDTVSSAAGLPAIQWLFRTGHRTSGQVLAPYFQCFFS